MEASLYQVTTIEKSDSEPNGVACVLQRLVWLVWLVLA
jgi:hypothetical protein